MKKILLISSIFLGGILFAQNANFKQNFSTSELEKIQKTLPENQKPELYRQYFRAKIFEDMKRDFNYKKYSDVLLKKFADTVIAGNTSNEIPENSSEIINSINQNFSNKLQNSEENYQLLAKNSGLFAGQYFPVATSQREEGAIYETIPGEILTYVTENGYAMGRHFLSYKISKDNLVPISPIPYENKNFEKKVSKYVKGEWRFEGRAGYEITKNKNGEYIILTSLYKEDDAACCPSMSLEYKTKDFKNFTPLRIAENGDELTWKTIK